jgi:hypothetical protein
MSQFDVVHESTEDTIGSAGNLQSAIRLAREAARQGQAGDLVSILECGGEAVRQFVLLPDGTVAEHAVARRGNPPAREAAVNGAEHVATADQPRD